MCNCQILTPTEILCVWHLTTIIEPFTLKLKKTREMYEVVRIGSTVCHLTTSAILAVCARGWTPMWKGRGFSSGIFFWPLRGTKKGVVQVFYPFRKGTKTGSIWDRKRVFHNNSFILSWTFPSLAPEPLSGTVSTPKCYCLMFSTLSSTRTRYFDP